MIVFLVILGVLSVLFVFPVCGSKGRLYLLRNWSGALIAAFGIKLERAGEHLVPGALLVANHISWIDIFVINAAIPAAFISKEEVRHWPVAGWLASRNDTVFLRRGSRGHARIINQQIGDLLARGRHVAVFPEGTTTDGTHLLHFHAALIQPALVAAHPVLPIAISYWEPDGSRSLAPRYDGEVSLGACARSILGRKQLFARLVITTPLGQNGEDRRQVAAQAREAIALAAGLPMPSNSPEKAVGLPGEQPSGARPTGSRNPVPAGLA